VNSQTDVQDPDADFTNSAETAATARATAAGSRKERSREKSSGEEEEG
jgi:hypothetical protein